MISFPHCSKRETQEKSESYKKEKDLLKVNLLLSMRMKNFLPMQSGKVTETVTLSSSCFVDGPTRDGRCNNQYALFFFFCSFNRVLRKNLNASRAGNFAGLIIPSRVVNYYYTQWPRRLEGPASGPPGGHLVMWSRCYRFASLSLL